MSEVIISSSHTEFVQSWTDIYREVEAGSAFLSPNWVDAWLDVYSGTVDANLLAVQDSESAREIGLCVVTRSKVGVEPLALRRVYFGTSGERDADSAAAECLAPLCAVEQREQVIGSVARWIEEQDVDEYVLPGVPSWVAQATSACLPEWSFDLEDRPAPFVDLRVVRESADGHLSSVSSNTRASLRRALRQYRRLGPLAVTEIAADQGAWDELVSLHSAHWRMKGSKGAFGSAYRAALLQKLLRANPSDGCARILRVTVGLRTIGMLLFLRNRGRVEFYQSGFDHDGDGAFQPGLVSHHLAIEHYASEGVDVYDFLSSPESKVRYKRSLSNSERTLSWVTLGRPGLRRLLFEGVRVLRRRNRPTRSGHLQG